MTLAALAALAAAVAMIEAGCGDDDDTMAAATAQSSSSAGAAGGSGGEGGAGGAVCPPILPMTATCTEIDRTCQYGSACCICANITCAIVFECVDPAMNDAACPAAPPPDGTMCTPNGPACSYCVGEVPRLMVCNQGLWAEGTITGCQ